MILLGILLLSFLLRFWKLENIPPGVMPDEAEFGYAAYSIIQTGVTHYGDSNFLLFSAPSDLYPPVYSYVLIPFISLFGLSIAVERLPSVLFGVFSCFLLFILIKQLYKNENAALFGSFLMAINPWAIFYSRQGRFEMIGIFLTLLGLVLFLHGIKKMNTKFFIFSAISFGVSLHANDATKIVVPMLFVGLFFLYWKRVKTKKLLLISVGVFLVFFFLMVKVLYVDGQIRDYSRSSLINTRLSEAVDAQRRLSNAPIWASSLFHNKATVFYGDFLSTYARIFSVNWLFIDGHGHPQESIGRHGQYMLFELPFFFIGFYLTWKKKKEALLILFWFLVGALPGSLTQGNFFPYRSILLLPVPLIYSGLGMAWFLQKTNSFSEKRAFLVRFLFTLTVGLFTSSFLFTYFFDFPVYSSEWRYKQRTDALLFAGEQADNYDRIFIGGNFASVFAFMYTVSPWEFQQAYSLEERYRGTPVITLGKYTFGAFPIQEISTPSAYFPHNSLIIVDGGAVTEEMKVVKKFTGTDPLRSVYTAFEVL